MSGCNCTGCSGCNEWRAYYKWTPGKRCGNAISAKGVQKMGSGNSATTASRHCQRSTWAAYATRRRARQLSLQQPQQPQPSRRSSSRKAAAAAAAASRHERLGQLIALIWNRGSIAWRKWWTY